jgi:hypothetical protein
MNINPFIGQHHLLLRRLLESERTSRARRKRTCVPFAILMGMRSTSRNGLCGHPGGDMAALVDFASLMHRSLALADAFTVLALAEEISFACFSCCEL